MTKQYSSPNAELAVRALKIAGNRELDKLHTVCTDDVLLEFPFWPQGPRRWTGLNHMIEQFSIEKVFTTFRIDVVEVFDAGDTVIVEATSEGAYPTDHPPYCNHYLFVFTMRDGKIAHWNEYFNPLEVLKQKPAAEANRERAQAGQ